jgi:hypothetical protein
VLVPAGFRQEPDLDEDWWMIDRQTETRLRAALRRWLSIVAVGGTLVAALAAAQSIQASPRRAICLEAHRGVPTGATIVSSGARLTLPAGAVVWVVLAGPASWEYSPWKPPRSSNVKVLAPIPFCGRGLHGLPSSAPLNWGVFRAVAPGKAVLSAPVATDHTEQGGTGETGETGGPGPTTTFDAYRAVVLVERRSQ